MDAEERRKKRIVDVVGGHLLYTRLSRPRPAYGPPPFGMLIRGVTLSGTSRPSRSLTSLFWPCCFLAWTSSVRGDVEPSGDYRRLVPVSPTSRRVNCSRSRACKMVACGPNMCQICPTARPPVMMRFAVEKSQKGVVVGANRADERRWSRPDRHHVHGRPCFKILESV